MFASIGHLVTRRRRAILGAALLLAVVAAALGIHAPGRLESAGFVSNGAPSQVAANRQQAYFGGATDVLLVVTATDGSIDSPAAAAAGEALTRRLAAAPYVSGVESYWSTRSAALRSTDGRRALVAARISGDNTQVVSRAKTLVAAFSVTRRAGGAVTVVAGGVAPASAEISTQINKDLATAESIAIPVTLVLLTLAFGSLVAAVLPVAIGVLAILATLAILYLLSLVTDVSVYALNLTTAMGLGLSIDYSLLMVGRYREELAAGRDPEAAVTRAIATAGRTIVFSGAAVAAALAALAVFPVYFLRSFAYAGVSVVAVAVAAALVVLPAILLALGQRVNALRVPGSVGRRGGVVSGEESARWRRVATSVTRHPWRSGLPVVAVLVVAMTPFLGVHFGIPDDRVLPASAPAHQAGDTIRSGFPADSADTADVLTDRPMADAAAARYETALSSIPGVVRVTGPAGTFAAGRLVGPGVAGMQSAQSTWVSAILASDAESAGAARVVEAVRAVPLGEAGVTAAVGGEAALLADQEHDLGSRLPLAMALIVLTTLVVLWLFTGSLVLPLKALILNALSLTAVFGAVVWVFQQGHLSSVLGFTPTPTSTTMPILLFCIAFGLSMDYEVFLLSRIKELHDRGVPNHDAVVGGLARVGGIVSAAAALLAVTFVAFGLSKVSFIKLFGLGTALAIVLDATVVRGVLVPAFMRLAGDANWWSPAPLRRLHARIGISEGAGPDVSGGPAPELVGAGR